MNAGPQVHKIAPPPSLFPQSRSHRPRDTSHFASSGLFARSLNIASDWGAKRLPDRIEILLSHRLPSASWAYSAVLSERALCTGSEVRCNAGAEIPRCFTARVHHVGVPPVVGTSPSRQLCVRRSDRFAQLADTFRDEAHRACGVNKPLFVGTLEEPIDQVCFLVVSGQRDERR